MTHATWYDTTAPKTFTKCDHYAKEGLSLIPDKEVEICLHKEELKG